MTTISTPSSLALVPSLQTAWQDVDSSFERFCLTAGIGAIEQMLREDAQQLAGAPHSRGGGRVGYRWGRIRARSASMVDCRVFTEYRIRNRYGPYACWDAADLLAVSALMINKNTLIEAALHDLKRSNRAIISSDRFRTPSF